MSIEQHHITINGMPVYIVRKDIKNLHLGVYPPDGRVRVAVPRTVTNDAVRLAVIGKLRWIRRQQEKFDSQARQSQREMVTGETHYFLGRRYRLRVTPHAGQAEITTKGHTIELRVRPDLDAGQRERALQRWYRHQLKELLVPLIEKWQLSLGVELSECRVKRMKTKWGTCNAKARRIWLNLELIKKPIPCMEYVVVHELVHLIERHHNDHFVSILDEHLPRWRSFRDVLNTSPLAHENWGY
jgi:predicted metal-dependent hydrolase